MTPHKHAAVIKAWADGAQVQCRFPNYYKNTWEDVPATFCWRNDLEYQVKPQVVKYRRYLCKDALSNQYLMGTLTADTNYTIGFVEKAEWFVRWIDTEWQEVEV